jgi:endonuclease YncB( thermonuclease family)
MRSLIVTLGLAIAALIQPTASARAEILLGVATAIDGTTLEIDGQTLRLLDIEVPALPQLCKDATGADFACGQRSSQSLGELLKQRQVTCDWSNLDALGRRLARCSAAGQDAGLWLVGQGWAVPDRTCKCETYRAAADRAKAQKLGLWAGVFQLP